MFTRKIKLGLAGLGLGIAFVVGACGEPTGVDTSQDTVTPAPQFKAVPLGDKDQAKTNQQIADQFCPLCGAFPESPSK